MAKAREELTQRGETPFKLVAEPSGAEFAIPEKNAGEEAELKKTIHPDPKNQVARDQGELVTSQVVVVSSTNPKANAVRVHLGFVPAPDTSWTNDAGNISFYLSPDSPVEIRDLKIPPLPKEISSSETRVLEFELHPKDGNALPKRIDGAAFYYVCTKTDQTCRFLRHEVVIDLAK